MWEVCAYIKGHARGKNDSLTTNFRRSHLNEHFNPTHREIDSLRAVWKVKANHPPSIPNYNTLVVSQMASQINLYFEKWGLIPPFPTVTSQWCHRWPIFQSLGLKWGVGGGIVHLVPTLRMTGWNVKKNPLKITFSSLSLTDQGSEIRPGSRYLSLWQQEKILPVLELC